MIMHRISFQHPLRTVILASAIVFAMLALLFGSGVTAIHAQSTNHQIPSAPHLSKDGCQGAVCSFHLQVNPGLLSDPAHPFACPAIQHAQARIVIVRNQENDRLTLIASGLPKKTAFDVFLVQNSPLDPGTFRGFGFGWYQSDLQSDGYGSASVTVQGIFDHETFIENPSDQFSPIHTFNVGFWFDSPTQEQQVCGNANAPAATPFNGEQHAGLLAMITQGEPLQFVA